MKLDNYKELVAFFHCDKFIQWREKLPIMYKIPDNELTYIIFDGLVKSYHNDMNIISCIRNACQFTTIVDSEFYRSDPATVLKWLMEGSNLYKNELSIGLDSFSEVKHIHTITNLKHNYIMVTICGVRRTENGKETFSTTTGGNNPYKLFNGSHCTKISLR